MLNSYSTKVKADNRLELDEARQELDGIKAKMDKIIQLVADSGISIDSVKSELKRLEDRKFTVEGYIQGKEMEGNAAAISEDVLISLINKSKEIVKARNIADCRDLIGNYVESITVYKDKVETKFKIGIPDANNNALTPMKIEFDLDELKEKYKKAV